MNAYIYNFEVYPNYVTCSFVPLDTSKQLIADYCKADYTNSDKSVIQNEISTTFIIDENNNQVNELIEFVNNAQLLIGYNNCNYDDNILDVILIHLKDKDNETCLRVINAVSEEIVNFHVGNYRYKNELYKDYKQSYISIDLMKVLLETVSRKSLNQVAINLKWYKIVDQPYLTIPQRKLTNDEKPIILEHGIGNCLKAFTMYWNGYKEIVNRFEISATFKVDVKNKNRSGTADILMYKFYAEESGKTIWQFKNLRTERRVIKFNEIINPNIEFKTKFFQDILVELKSINYKVGDKFSRIINYNGTGYKLATGGLHSIDRPLILLSNDKYTYIDADVEGYYPNLIINEKIAPKHLDKLSYLNVCKRVLTIKNEGKREGNKIKQAAGKIVANSGLFGKLGYENGFQYDLQAMYAVTLNGQLRLLQLIERLELNGFHVVSANTDGIVTKVSTDWEEEVLYYDICNEWCKDTGLKLEFTQYSKYIRRDVNNYISIKTNGDIKTKGIFELNPDISKGYSAPIIAKALYEYFVNGISIRTTIHNSRDIYDFCLSQKTGGQFNTETHEIDEDGEEVIETITKTNRYYVSTNGLGLVKKYKDKEKRIGLVSKEYITIFNIFEDKPFEEYHVKYSYYLDGIFDIVSYIENTNYKLSKKVCGTMFDEIE